jgi:hypothetical protein
LLLLFPGELLHPTYIFNLGIGGPRGPYTTRVFEKFPKYLLKILLGNFNPKVRRQDIFKPSIGNESLHEVRNDSGIG